MPARFVPRLRRGLLGELEQAARELADLLAASGERAPDASFPAPLHALLTILVPLGEIGWREAAAPPGDVVINLGIGGRYIVSGLREEHLALHGETLKSKSISKDASDAASAEVAELGKFVQVVEEQVDGMNRRPERPATTHPPSRPPLRAKPSRARRSQR